MKSKILFILNLPPPVHGSAVVGQYIKDSKVVDNAFDTRFINLSTSLTIDEIGKKPIRKITRYFKILFKVIVSLIFYNPKVVYIAITSKGPGFYKDFPIALFAKLFKKYSYICPKASPGILSITSLLNILKSCCKRSFSNKL